MRNLKKVLSLVLALMMVLSVMVTASAAEFTDAADIEYTEAVEVLAGIGVIKGTPNADGTSSYLPDDILNREAAAAIVSRLLNGGEDVSAAVAASLANPFTDVSGWSTNAIKWCYNEGIINGVSATSFLPKEQLKGYAFAKMLLVAIGVEGEYTGSAWQYNVLTAADEAGLLAGLPETILDSYLTREQAAQMAFNALFYYTEGSYGYPVIDPDTEAVLGYYPTLLEAATAAKVLDCTYGTKPVAYNTDSLAADYGLTQYTVTKTQENWEDIGYEGYYWYVEVDGVDGYNYLKDVMISSFVCTDKTVGTYTKANSYKEISTALGKTGNYTVDVYENGVLVENDKAVNPKDTTKVSADSSKTLTVVVRSDKDKSVDFLYTQETLATAKNLGRVSNDKTDPYYNVYTWEFKDLAGNVLTYDYGYSNSYSPYVMYLVVNTATPAISAAPYVTGNVTATAASYIRVDGAVVYKANANVAVSTLNNVFYLNTAGDIIYATNSGAVETVYDGYAYVTLVEYIGTPYSSTGLVGAGTDASITAKAVITTAAGETSIVDVATRIYKSGNDYVVEYYLNGQWNKAETDNTAKKAYVLDWCGYTKDENGAYKFGAVDASDITAATKKTAHLTIGEDKYFLTTATKISFVSYNLDTGAVATQSVTGYANITDSIAAALVAANKAVVVADSANVVSSITVYMTENVEDAVNYAIYIGAGETDTATGATTYNFFVNGEYKDYVVVDGVLPAGIAYGTIVDFKTNADGHIYELDTVEPTQVTVAAVSADGTYLIDTNNGVHMLAEGYVVYDYATGYTTTELAAEQIVEYVVNSDGAIVMIIVIG